MFTNSHERSELVKVTNEWTLAGSINRHSGVISLSFHYMKWIHGEGNQSTNRNEESVDWFIRESGTSLGNGVIFFLITRKYFFSDDRINVAIKECSREIEIASTNAVNCRVNRFVRLTMVNGNLRPRANVSEMLKISPLVVPLGGNRQKFSSVSRFAV